MALQLPMLVGGVYSLPPQQGGHWPTAGAWQLPVGSPGQFGLPAGAGEPAFKLNRGLEGSPSHLTHTGADLADGRSGDTVRAAASGLVALAYDGDNGNGYGGHVVLAHRLEDEDRTLYTVYAHLQRGSITVQPGDVVCGGDAIGLVGQTGRASTPHLHFEVRQAVHPDERWENARVLDPLEFVRARCAPGVDTSGADGPYLRWAAAQGLASAAGDPGAPIVRGQWWHMLARAVEGGPDRPGLAPEALRDSLMGDGVLPEEESGAPADEQLAWAEMARDVKRLHQLGVRVPHGPLAAEDHAAHCEARFGQRAPGAHAGALRHLPGEPSLADACVVLADLSGPPPARHPHAPRHAAKQVKARKGARVHARHGKAAHHKQQAHVHRRHPNRQAAVRAPGA